MPSAEHRADTREGATLRRSSMQHRPARRDARAAFYSISFSGAFSLWLYTGAAYPYAAISVKI
eukprot:scaffold79656_cov60-Phaeocystis_antarctica.AAC.3